MSTVTNSLNKIFFRQSATPEHTIASQDAGVVYYGTIVDGGLLIDDSGDGSLLPGPFATLVPYMDGNRVAFVLRSRRPLILSVEGGFGASDEYAGLASIGEVNAEDVSVAQQLAGEAKARADAAQEAFDEFVPSVNGEITALQDRAEQVTQEMLVERDRVNGELGPVKGDLAVLKSETLPALDTRLTAAKTAADKAAADLLIEKDRVNGELGPVKTDLSTLKTTTLPALQTTLNAANAEVTTLKTTTLPALRSDLTASEGKVATLQNTTIPNLQTALTNVEGAAQSADKRSTVSTAAPSATTGFPQNAAWQRINASGAVIGSWRLSGSSWVQMPLDPVVIPNLSAGIITSGVLNTARLNASEVAAAVGSFLSLSAGQITSGKINTDRLTASEVAAAVANVISLNASRITAGTINTDRLDAQTIAARVAEFLSIKTGQIAWDNAAGNNAFISRLVSEQFFTNNLLASRGVFAPDNLVPDPTFISVTTDRGLGGGWDAYKAGSGSTAIRWRGSATAGYFDLMITRSGSPDSSAQWQTCNGGDSYLLTYRVYKENYPNYRWQVNYESTDGTRGNVAGPTITTAGSSTATQTWEFTLPATAARFSIRAYIGNPDGLTTGTWAIYGDSLALRRKTGSVLIEDGAVNANKITASEELSAKVAEFLSVKTGQITWDNAAGNNAFIGSLVGEQAFLTQLYTNRILVDTASNLWPNGWDEYTDNRGMNNAFVYRTTGTQFPGMSSYFTVAAGTGSIYVFNNQEQVSVNPGDTYILDVWLRASNNNTAFFLEIKDQAGSPIPNSAYTVLAGPSRGSGNYPLANVAPTTSSTLWSIAIKIPAGVNTLRGLRAVFNHANGTAQNASYAFACRLRHQTSSVLIENGAVSADKLAATIALVTRIIAGPEDGYHTEMNQTGIKFRSKIAGVTNPVEILKINTPGTDSDGDVFTLLNPNDLSESTMSINEAGQGSFSDLSVANVTQLEDVIVKGQTLPEVVPRVAAHIVASKTFSNEDWGVSWTGNRFISSVGWKRALEIVWENTTATPRTLWIPTSSITLRTAAAMIVGSAWGYTLDGSAPVANSGGFNAWQTTTTLGYHTIATKQLIVEVPAGATFKARLDIYNGGAEWVFDGKQAMTVWDLGPVGDYSEGDVIPSDLSISTGGSASGGAASKKQYTKTWNTAWLRTFPVNSFYAGKATQGTYNGTTFRGFLGFPNMLSDIGSADIVKIEAYVYMSHWWYNAGGTLSIQGHGQLLEPTAQPGVSGTVVSLKTAKPGGGWVTLPSTYHAGFKAGTLRGIALVGSGLAAYGYATSGQIRVTYKK